MLYEVSQRMPRADAVQEKLLDDFRELSREAGDAKTNFIAELNLANALFDTQFSVPIDESPLLTDQAELTEARRCDILDNIRAAIPIRSRECATMTQKLMVKLRD